MKHYITYFILFLAILTGCEEIYNPEIEAVENVIVADARLVAGTYNNEIKLYKSLGYNDNRNAYPPVSGAVVSIIDDKGKETRLQESAVGHFPVNIGLNPSLKYKMKIEYGGNTYESGFEPVPKMPEIDTVFGVPETKIFAADGENDIDDFKEVEGVQLYCNILNKNELPYYRFTATQIMQYYYYVQVPFFGTMVSRAMWCWSSQEIGQSFNIAAPPEYGTTNIILKHPLYFMPKKVYIDNGYSFSGWILIMHQYRISQSGYLFYNDLNSQLGWVYDKCPN